MAEEKHSQTSAQEAEGTLDNESTPEANEPETGRQAEPTVDYKEKFSQSSAEALRIREENRRLQDDMARERVAREALEKEKRELEELARGTNPEGYDNSRLRKHIEELSTGLAQMKERQELADFVGSTPEASKYRDTLRDLGRTYPNRTYSDLWESSLRTVADAERTATEARAERKKAEPDSGRGSTTGEPNAELIGGYPLEKFNKLPMEKRKEIFKKLQAKGQFTQAL